MAASTTITNVKPEAVDELVRFVCQVVGTDDAKQMKTPELVAFMVKHGNDFIEKGEDQDVEGCFQILFFDVQNSSQSEIDGYVTDLTKLLTQNTESKPRLRLGILASLFNAISSATRTGESGSSLYVTLFLAIVEYCGKTGQIQLLQGYIDLLGDLVEKWQLSKEDQRRLFLDVSKALEANGQEEKAQMFLLKFLVTFDAGEVPTSEVDTVAKAVVGAIRNPIVSFMERHNLLGLSAVAALQNEQKHMKLYELLRIFTEGKLAEYLTYHEANPGTLDGYGLSHENCVAHMRLLSMASLATEHEEIPYAEIAKDLQVPLEEVETWVVKTITAKLIDAKMDQLQQRVIISRCTHRMFDRAQWEQLREKLHNWKANLRGVLDTLERTQAHQDAAAMM